jgi:hypothetical protein
LTQPSGRREEGLEIALGHRSDRLHDGFVSYVTPGIVAFRVSHRSLVAYGAKELKIEFLRVDFLATALGS